MAAYLKQKFDRDVHFRRKMISFVRSCAIYGTCIGKTPYRKEKKTVPKKRLKSISNFYGIFQSEFTEEEVITFDSIDLELVDLFDFYVADDFNETIEDQPYILHRTVEYYDLMYKKVYDKELETGIYENIDGIS